MSNLFIMASDYASVNPTYSKVNSVACYDTLGESYSTTQDTNKNNYYCGGQSSLALRGLQISNTPVSMLYFSDENIDRIQKMLRNEVYRRTNNKIKLIGDQDHTDLLVNMQRIFVDNAKNLPCQVVRQVKELNKHTINVLVPDLITNSRMHAKYLKDISSPIIPLPLPLNVNRAGRRSLGSNTQNLGF